MPVEHNGRVPPPSLWSRSTPARLSVPVRVDSPGRDVLTPTAEQVRTLAPDASAARAAERLAHPGRWSGTGRTESAAWGLCQGSGSSPYQTTVDLAGPAYRCSCPSRKIPCKHALGLMLLVADGKLDQASPPDWAASWLDSRASRTATAAKPAQQSGEADPAARAKRIESRERKVAAGIEELDRWLGDLMRRGLDSARGEGYRFWDAMAARLVDAQAGGLGRSVRGLGSAASAAEAWPHLLLEGTARLHLLCEAYRRADRLPESLRADVRSLVGWTTKEEDLDPAEAVEDRWLVVGRRVDDTGQVITARTFLLGESSARFALHLAFGVDAAPPTVLAMPGQAFRAALAFYPSATPLRAAVRPMLVPDGEITAIPGGQSIRDAVVGHAERLARNPFLDAWPVAVGEVVPVVRGESLLVREEDGTALPVFPDTLGPRLLAISGGGPVTVVGEWDGSFLRPLSVLAGSRLVGIDSTDDAPRTVPPDSTPGWSELVSAALLGTERSGGSLPVPGAAMLPVDGRDREHALLAAAGVLAVRRRAARRPPTDPDPLPVPAPDDPRPVLGGAAARLFGLVVTEQRSLLPEILGLVRASGRRPPDEWLPELLALAADDADRAGLRSSLAEVAGPRAVWLATLVPELAEGAAPTLGSDWEEAWESARGARQRAAVARAMRRADPGAARESLGRWLPGLAGDERSAVVEALEEGLGPEDEPLLVAALGDRRVDVRRAAAGLLARLEGSLLARLLEARARPLLATQGRLRPGLAVTLPTLDAELEEAGFGGRPPAGLGERAWLLRQLLAHVRPARWNEWLRVDPPGLVERTLRAEEARPVLEGLIQASARFADEAWTTALLAQPKVAATVRLDPTRSLGALPADGRTAVVVAVARSVDPETLAHLAEACPPPWPAPLVDAAFVALGKLAGADYPEQALYDLVRAAALGIPPDRAEDLVTLASHAGVVRPALCGAIETVRLRARIHDAFSALPRFHQSQP